MPDSCSSWWCPARLTVGITYIIICRLVLGLPATEGGVHPQESGVGEFIVFAT